MVRPIGLKIDLSCLFLIHCVYSPRSWRWYAGNIKISADWTRARCVEAKGDESCLCFSFLPRLVQLQLANKAPPMGDATESSTGVSRGAIEEAVARGKGVVFAEPALVGRPTYVGRNLIAQNSSKTPETVDDRG